jgi:hypothetical protein
MFVPVACSQCGKPFQVPDAAIGKPTACPWCQATVLALPVGSQPPADSPPQTEDRTAGAITSEEKKPEVLSLPGNREPINSTEPLSLDDEPAPQPRATQEAKNRSRSAHPTSRFSCIVMVLAGLLLMVATTALTLLVLQRKQGHLVTMEWKSFTAPDGSCGIDLLGPATETDSDPENGERRYMSEGWYSGATAWIGWRALTPAQVQEATAKEGWVQYRKLFFDKERERLKDMFGGYVARDATIEQNPVTVEVRLDGAQGAVIERMIVMPNGPRPRIYFIGMAGKRLKLDGPEVKRLLESFRVYD